MSVSRTPRKIFMFWIFVALDCFESILLLISGIRIPRIDSRMAISRLGVRSVGEMRGIGRFKDVKRTFS